MQLKLLLSSLLLVSVYCSHGRRERIRPLTDMINYPDLQESYFRTNKMYTFQYDGQISIGVPDHSDQQSTSRMRADVTLVKRSDEHFVLRCRNVRLGKQLSRIQEPQQMQSFDKFEQTQMGSRETSVMELPVEFTYADGQIQDLVFQQKEEEWSANMKRGIINMLQIKLQPKDRDSMEEEQSALNKLDTESKTDIAQVYRTNEKTVEGQCDTMYSVNFIQSHDDQSSSTMLVTKTVDLNSCQKRPKIMENFQFTQDCPSCSIHNTRDKLVKSSTVLRYKIRGRRDKFLVESVQMSNDHVFSPQNADENSVVVTIRASLRLTNSKEADQQSMESFEFPQTGQQVSDLIYSTETEEKLVAFQTQGDQYYPKEWQERPPYGEQDLESKFGEYLMKMVRHMRSSIDEKASRSFYKLVSLVRLMKESQIKSIHKQYFTRHQSGQITAEEREKIRNIMPHIYAQAGTINAIRHLSEKIASGEISPYKATVVMPMMMNAPHVSKEMINEMLRLEQSSTVQQNTMLRRVTWLAIGSMMRTACYKRSQTTYSTSDKSSSEPMSSCSSDTEQRFVRAISERLQNRRNWEDKILYLRVLGNAALPSSIQEIENMLSNQGQSYRWEGGRGQSYREEGSRGESYQGEGNSAAIRIEAVMALRNLRQSLPQKTRNILLASAMNKMESSAVRMAAVQQLLQDNPGKLVIDQLVSLVNEDSDRRVASFAYRLMKSLSESKQPCYAEMNKNLKPAIKRVKRISANMPTSDVFFESMNDMNKRMGMDVFLFPFYESDEIVPKFIRFGINQNSGSRRINNLLAMEMGSSGLSSILADLVETVPERQAGSVHYKLNMRRFADKMQRSSWKSGQPKTWMSLKLKNQDILLYTLNEQRLKELFSSGNTGMISTLLSGLRYMSHSTNVDKAVLLHETSVKIPTAMGTQLRIKKKMPAMLNIHGHTRPDIQGTTKGRLDINGKLNAIISMVTDVRSKTPILSNGIYLIRTAKASIPFDITVSADPSQSDELLKIDIRHSDSSRDMIKLESRPVIYFKRSVHSPNDEEKTIVADKNTKMESFKKCLQIPVLGSEFCVRGLISKPTCEHNKLTHYIAPWFGPNKVVFSVYPSDSGNQQVTLTGSVNRRFDSSDKQSEEDVSYRFTVKSQSHKQNLDLQISKFMGSIIPKQVKARYTQSTNNQHDMEVCMQMNTHWDDYQFTGSQKRSSESKKMKIDAKINWGRQCQPENYVQAKIETTLTPRLYVDQSRSLSSFEDQASSNYLTFQDETSECKVQLSHNNVPRFVSHYGEKALDFLIYKNYWNTHIKRPELTSSSSRKQSQESIQMNITGGKADIRIQTSRKTVILEDVRVPSVLRYERMARSNLVRLTNIIVNQHARASCFVQDNSIRTFDNAVYRIPFTDCYTILAKDEASRFTVMAKQSKSQQEKTVKVFTADHEIKLKPEQGSTNIYLDGKKWQEDSFTDQRSIKISRSGRTASIKLVKQNVEISSDGNLITIQVPEKNHGQQEGMCGNLNADSSDDFGKRHWNQRNNVMQAWKEMTLDDGQCQQATEQNEMDFEHPVPYEQSDDFDSNRRQMWSRYQSPNMDSYDDEPQKSWSKWDSYSRQSSDSLEIEDVLTEVMPVRQNKIVERYGQPCVSIRPIERCPEHSYIADNSQSEREVQYTCLNKQDPLLSQISQQRRRGQSMDLADREVSFSRSEVIPRKCIAIV